MAIKHPIKYDASCTLDLNGRCIHTPCHVTFTLARSMSCLTW